MKLPKFSQVSCPTLKALIFINDMFRFRASLSSIREQAKLKGFNSVASAKTFKQAREAINAELKKSIIVI